MTTDKLREALKQIVARCRKQAEESMLESSRIRRTVGHPTEAETNCVVRAELWREISDELAALAALADSAVKVGAGETGWLIERRDREGIEWLVCDSGGFEWTLDPLKPIRFCRREDADQVASVFDDIDVRITEHKWGL